MLGKSPGRGYDNPLQYSCPENSHGKRSLVGYSPWGHTESDTTEATKQQQQYFLKSKDDTIWSSQFHDLPSVHWEGGKVWNASWRTDNTGICKRWKILPWDLVGEEKSWWGFPCGLNSKESAWMQRPRFNPWVGKVPWETNGNPLWYTCMEDYMERRVWQATVHGVTKSWTWLTNTTTTKGVDSLKQKIKKQRSEVENELGIFFGESREIKQESKAYAKKGAR